MVAKSIEKHWGQMMGGTKATIVTIDDLRAAVRSNITDTIDIITNIKGKIRLMLFGIRSQ